jgi:PKD repeat protein
MKKILNILVLLFVIIQANAQNQPAGCCPEFSLTTGFQPCDKNRECDQGPTNGGAVGNPPTPGQANYITACRNQAHTYLVVPNLPGFTYSWTVVGGTPNTTTGNPVVITWGNNNQGYIEIIIKNADSTCRDTIRKKVCLINGPTAAFTFAPNPVCLNSSVCFNSTASVGANSYYWDFGDGTSSTLANPCHTFTTAGPHNVILTVSASVDTLADCGCKDTAKAIINVSNKKGIDIYTDDCRKMLCAGDTVKYCTSATGCTFGPGNSWTVNGGTIISGQNTNCITVVWNVAPTTLPTSVTLNASCPGTCGNTATLNVPVLFPNLPIQGPYIVCPGTTASYSLPALPGTFYKWTISGGGTIAGYDSNHNVINVQWGTTPGGPHIITCNYNNPYSGCKGTDTIGVYIKPRFQLFGPSPVCTNTVNNYFANGPVATWTFIPNTGFTNSPIGATGQAVNWSVAGNYDIIATPNIPGNYCTPSATINVVVNPTPVLNPIVGPIVVCPNQLYNYTASSNLPGGNYVWTFTSGTGSISPYGPNNSSASIIFSGSGPWVLKATQTLNGCSGSTTLSITKVPAPTGITLSAPGVCSGGSITATAVGGAAPYTWTASPGAVLTGTAGATATFTINSAATITVANCSGSVSTNVTVTPATVSLAFVLGNCNATITATPGGGTYVWYLNGNLTAYTGSSIVVTQNGNYVVVATYPGGCTATSQITVSGITPVLVSISGTGNLCNGGSVSITAAIQANCPGAVFTWSNGFVGNPLVTNTPGSYFVTVTCSNGCTAKSNVINVSPCPVVVGNCINDLILNPPSNCPNPIALTTNVPAGCTPVSTAWFYGDGFGGPTGNHLYNTVGNYTVLAIMTCADGTKHCGTKDITIPMIDSFTYVVSCGANAWSVQLQDASTFLLPYAGYSILWTTSCGSLSANNIPNPVLTVPMGCNPTVTLTISKLGCTLVKSFTFGFPTTAFAINGPSTVCKGANNVFSSNYTTGVIAYAWNFGDATSGVTNPITHAFNGTPPNPTITLQITDQFGCNFTATKPITVITPTPLTISPSPLVKICPDCTPPVTLTTNPLAGFTSYQWYQNGAAIPLATNATYQLCNFNASGSYYVTAINSANNNCPVTSDTVNVVYLPKPLAHIQGQTVQCAFGSSPYSIYLQNQGGNNPNYTYVWTATGPGSVTFTPDNLQFNANASVTQLGTYQFILTVTDITTGCKAKDTFCVYLYLSPTVTITAPANMCEGTMYTLTANPSPTGPNYIYQWSNGATTQSITTGQTGSYTVSVTDPVSGCTGYSSAVKIKKRPYVDLFPIGCDTLCDTAKLIPPLPLAPGQNYGGVYIIKWYVDGNLYFTGSPLVLAGLSLGQHQIYIVVTDIATGCTSTSGKYDLFIKHCGDCDCKESHWGETQIEEGEHPKEKNNIKANVGQGGKAIAIKCGTNLKLDCKKTYTVSSSYNCKDTACAGKVTYSLQPPTGPAITGTGTITFTTNVSGTYVLTMYAWCGDKKCDSCVIKFEVNCVECECKGSKWGEQILTIDNVSQPFKCDKNKTIDVKCKKPITVNANYLCADEKCNSAVTYSLQPPTGGPTTGNLPLTFTPLQSGTYTLTMYGWCGTTLCDSCVIKFKTVCDPEDCCPYEIKATTGTVTYDYTQIPNATVAAQTFTINGLALASITEVRANVVSYTVDDNYKGDCMKCVNLPFTWASIASAANIGAVPGLITMYGGTTVPSFNGGGADAYKNPREIVWNNGSLINIPNGTNIGINFILPPVPAIDCCELKGKICVKFTFRDKDCKECEVIACFDFVIKKK